METQAIPSIAVRVMWFKSRMIRYTFMLHLAYKGAVLSPFSWTGKRFCSRNYLFNPDRTFSVDKVTPDMVLI